MTTLATVKRNGLTFRAEQVTDNLVDFVVEDDDGMVFIPIKNSFSVSVFVPIHSNCNVKERIEKACSRRNWSPYLEPLLELAGKTNFPFVVRGL